MNPRNPPALANWLLNHSGYARQNPPLAGDLLEEFEGGRSKAWFWRQTIVVVATGLAQNARLFWRPLAGAVTGWMAQVVVTFVLWRLHFFGLTMMLFVGLMVVLKKKLKNRSSNLGSLSLSAGDQFINGLIFYSVMSLKGVKSPDDFIVILAVSLVPWVFVVITPPLVWVMNGLMPKGRHRLPFLR